jgi:hypothetical protein
MVKRFWTGSPKVQLFLEFIKENVAFYFANAILAHING